MEKAILKMKHTLPLAWLLALAATSISAAEWPQFHGPNRDNKSTESSLLEKWSEGGPTRIWEIAGIDRRRSRLRW